MGTFTDTWKSRIMNKLQAMRNLSGVVAVVNRNGLSVLTEGSDLLLILVSEADLPSTSIYHYIKDGIRIQERSIAKCDLEEKVLSGDDSTVIHWMMQGEIWVDHDAYLEGLRTRLLEFPAMIREQKLLNEFSLFLKRYLLCKEYLQADHILDAYSSILRAIHHWARIVVIEEGAHPEVTVWQQVRRLNPGVYKLYEELTTSSETLKQRVELVLLACDFSAMSKIESCCRPIIRILEESDVPLGIGELVDHEELSGNSVSVFPLLLNRLAKKQLIKEVAVAADDDFSSMEVKYTK